MTLHDVRRDPTRPLIEGGLSERQVRAWAAHSGMADLEQRVWLARRGLMPISGGGEVTLRKIQAGIESTRGTGVPATRKVYAKGTMTKDLQFMAPDEDRGTFIRQYRSSMGIATAAFPMTAGLTYEDLPWWGQSWLKGSVAGVVRNTAAYDYEFVPTPDADDLESVTYEWGDDTQAFEMDYGMVDTFDITGSLDNFWSADIGVIGATMDNTSFTAALDDRDCEDINTYLTKCAIGAAGSEPSSYMTGRFIGFRLTSRNNLARKFFADGASPALGGMGRGKREFTLEVTMEGNAATVTERGEWEDGTKRVVRLTAQGTAITGATPTTYKTADIIVPGKWSTYVVGDRDTNTIFTGTLAAEYDLTLTYDFKMLVTNDLTTLP